MKESPKVLAVIPGYNEEAGIAAVVRESRAILPVLVVDDGSRDRTADMAEAAGAQVLRQRPNQGKGAALRAGFRYALEHGFESRSSSSGTRRPARSWSSEPGTSERCRS